ncbi:MAG: glutamyl-tRNA(Gln) amidotransferase subunit C, aspartyl-tRNA(Asn)/glutamyl-tRNA (Gln) amidotransferase subunit C [Candidatus Peregrinibacteria bacterium GW2011_GWF2_38_29]|nr:MAG: glutamyl-tRNA(Gln) amidotransferase subunit C, aspartyl-tRNA(Asn)/glutamyl-tRNA (Gln) amidotransferase subunit C [Candidatus Peregrinibacteria bacterium GW2011_GWF2_38_29]HBB02234.1 Asp-tRNA(Asn)/Glu-tRNA(Gln) amidotransferase GatCAB subunit C [Candidatus Peregrinibacteria bacterium]
MLSEEEVKHIAKLARIRLTDAEIKKYSTQLTDILEYVKILEEVDTKNFEPTSQVTGLKDVTREDVVVSNSATGEDLLKCSTLPVQNNQIKVKPVIKQ